MEFGEEPVVSVDFFEQTNCPSILFLLYKLRYYCSRRVLFFAPAGTITIKTKQNKAK
jgi:hypothetical protein